MVSFDSFCKTDDRLQAAVAGPPVPSIQKIGRPIAFIGENVLESKLDPPCPGNLEITQGTCQFPEGFFLVSCKVFQIFEPDIAGLFQSIILFLFLSAHFVQGLVHELHDEENSGESGPLQFLFNLFLVVSELWLFFVCPESENRIPRGSHKAVQQCAELYRIRLLFLRELRRLGTPHITPEEIQNILRL